MNSGLSHFGYENQVLQKAINKAFQTTSFSGAVTVLFDGNGKVTDLNLESVEVTSLNEQLANSLIQTLEKLWRTRLVFGHAMAASVRIFSSMKRVYVNWEAQSLADSTALFNQLNLIIQPLSFERENDLDNLARGQCEVAYIHGNTASWPTKKVQIMVQRKSSVIEQLSEALKPIVGSQSLIEISTTEWSYSDNAYFCNGVEIRPLTLAVDDYSRLFPGKR